MKPAKLMKIVTKKCAYNIVENFEKAIAEYAGAKYGVAVDSCCNAIFLCLKYLAPQRVSIPVFTYPGVACAVKNSGAELYFDTKEWEGSYMFGAVSICDSALRFKKDMYIKDTYYCLSFHAKKHLPIGRGGMILTDDKNAYEWFKKARFDGRNTVPLYEDKIDMIGYNMYLTPEQAARGLMLFETIKYKNLPDIDAKTQGYPDLSLIEAYK